jgi:hypothetical protein
MFAKLTAGCLLLLCAFGAQQAKADNIYEVIGSMTIPGNAANPGVGETINYSFEMDYFVDPQYGPQSNVIGTPIVTSFGALGTAFYVAGAGGQANGYVGFFSGDPHNVSNGFSEIDLEGIFHPTFGPSPIPSQGPGSVYLWSCIPPLPCSEFAPPGTLDANGELWTQQLGTNTSAVYLVSTPEPGTLCLFALGALMLGLIKKYSDV